MDAQAYLIRHGWSGPGNPLNPNQRPGPHGGLGLTKPILVARKQNNHGVGKKTTKVPTNQWWLRGFEDALKGVGDDSPAAVSAKTNNALTSELYRFFVRGEGLAGTLEKKKADTVVEKTRVKSKRKRDAEEEDDPRARKEDKAARKEEKRQRRKVKGVDSTGSSEVVEKQESKDERRLRKEKKREKKSRKSVLSLSEGGSKDLKQPKKLKRAAEENYPTPMSTEQELEPVRSKEARKSKKGVEDGGKSKRKSQKEKKEKS